MAQPPVRLREQESGDPGRFFQRGRFLSIDEIAEELGNMDNRENPRMLEYITKRCNNPCMETMRRSRARLTVSWLQHVTGKEGFEGITRYQCFIGNPKNISASEIPEMTRFSWWSVVTNEDDVTSLRNKAYQDLLGRKISSEIARRTRKVKNQFANSPVFKESSRYGNFKFSFSVQQLLDAYEAQHCVTPGELVFRVLGTWTYEQEILHAVLIHGSQYNEEFSDLPEITRDLGEPIYRHNDGRFRCKLESSSDRFTLHITPNGVKALDHRCDRCVWSNPAFAFYLPEGTGLEMQIRSYNLKACKILKPAMLSRGKPTPYPEAE